MKRRSVQEVEDFYINLGYRGAELRKVVEKDKEWQRLIKAKRKKMIKKMKLTPREKKKYVIATDRDVEILSKVKELERNKKVTRQDRFLLKVIKTQLEPDWRGYLIKTVNKLLKKYKI